MSYRFQKTASVKAIGSKRACSGSWASPTTASAIIGRRYLGLNRGAQAALQGCRDHHIEGTPRGRRAPPATTARADRYLAGLSRCPATCRGQGRRAPRRCANQASSSVASSKSAALHGRESDAGGFSPSVVCGHDPQHSRDVLQIAHGGVGNVGVAVAVAYSHQTGCARLYATGPTSV